MFWIDEPTSFRWNRRFDFAPINVRPNIPGWEPHYKPDVLYKVDAERWKDRENIDTMGLHFRVEVTGVKELFREKTFDAENKTGLAKEGYLKGMTHFQDILILERQVFSSIDFDTLSFPTQDGTTLKSP